MIAASSMLSGRLVSYVLNSITWYRSRPTNPVGL